MLAALFLGAVLYFLALSRPALFLAGLVADALAFLWHLATRPLVWLGRLGKKIMKIQKNHFHYRRKWYNMKLIPEEMEDLSRRQAGTTGENAVVRTKKAGLLTKIVVLALLIYMATALLNLQGQLKTARAEQDSLSRQLTAQTQTNADLADAVAGPDDPDRIADIARDKLGLVAPGRKSSS